MGFKCPKRMLNGPCSSYRDNLCELGDVACPWIGAYKVLSKYGKLNEFFKFRLDPDFVVRDYYPVTRRSQTLVNKLLSGKLMVFYEVYIPKYHRVLKHLEELKELAKYVDFYVIPDSPFGLPTPHVLTVATAIKLLIGNSVITEISCRNKTKEEFIKLILTSLSLGIEDFIITTGDLPLGEGGEYYFELDSCRATYLTRLIADLGIDHKGRYVSLGGFNVSIGVVTNPNSKYLDLEVGKTLRKLRCGANVVFLQLTYDFKLITDLVKALRNEVNNLPIVPLFVPLKKVSDVNMVKHLGIRIGKNVREKALDYLRKGKALELNIELLRNLIEVMDTTGLSSIYISTYGDITLAKELIKVVKGVGKGLTVLRG